MVRMACGYVLELSQARNWAERIFPQMRWSTSEQLTHSDIRSQLKLFFLDNVELERCLIIWWRESEEDEGAPWIFFPTDWFEVFYITGAKPHPYQETETALEVKKALFEPFKEELSYLQNIRFVMIYDPYNTN
ncbi:hypothetical protein PAXINDRAFT_102770 [Paxillus involutus ATCC 200175]|uniref:Uncharacterized protein n=1 Tax=Paxillus involutus ATCC 200175 TaxID=664439 RepID=A0A0C9TIV0_PAXIN|nr:hypothetical protein PAXINDRAFT_102770 [Paxillus involutus ATCC 200175]